MTRLNDEDKLFLAEIVCSRGYHIDVDNIISAGRLLEREFVRADSDYEGPMLYATDEGVAFAKRLKLVADEENEHAWSPYRLTDRARDLVRKLAD